MTIFFGKNFGWSKLIIFMSIFASINSLISSFFNNFLIWIIFFSLKGMAFGILETITWIYLSEISGKKFTFNSNLALNLTWSFS